MRKIKRYVFRIIFKILYKIEKLIDPMYIWPNLTHSKPKYPKYAKLVYKVAKMGLF